MTKGSILGLIILSGFLIFQAYITTASRAEVKVLSTKCDSLQYVVDSLHAENYQCQIELNRYQMAHKILLRRNLNAAKQYSDIISNETE
jgi:hypothetical protein